jgi:hypothetical protein
MAIDLSQYRSIQTNMFVRLDIPGYQVLTFSDYHRNLTVSGTDYTGLGQLLAISNTEDSLRAAPSELSISIAGIPSSNVTDIVNNRIKGSACQVYRGFFDVDTGILLPITGNPAGKFQGVVSNYDIADELEQGSDTGTVRLTLTVTSVVELLQNKVAGRRTNASDFPAGDMNRVLPLQKSNFNFGAPTQ